jgi:FAD:protein FMN transferase
MRAAIRPKALMRRVTVLFLILLPNIAYAEVVQETRDQMGTRVTIMIWSEVGDDPVRASMNNAFKEIDRINDLFSIYIPGSEISRLNDNAGKQPVKVRSEVFRMLEAAARMTNKTGGAFDPTFAGAGKLWDFRPGKQRIPSKASIETGLENTGIGLLVLDRSARTAFLTREGAKFDPGGYIKGYAVDRASEVLRRLGYEDFIVNAGGDMYVSGSKGGKPWRVGVQNPRANRDKLLASLAVKDRAVVTSGDYERFFIKDGVRYHHILDPRSGKPARLCRSTTVVAKSTMQADFLSTAVFVLGPESGARLLREYGAEGFIIDSNGGRHFTPGFKSIVQFDVLD